jgi:hypothetical protein
MTENPMDKVPEPNPEKPLIPKSRVQFVGARLRAYVAEREGPRPMCMREFWATIPEWAGE